MPKILYPIQLADDERTLAAAAAKLQLQTHEIDTRAGLMQMDIENHRYGLLIEQSAAIRLRGTISGLPAGLCPECGSVGSTVV
jgi:hypothetical protein